MMIKHLAALGRMAALCSIAVAIPLSAQWKALGPFGGSAALVQSDPNASRTLIAGTANALLFRSRDNGATWVPLLFPPQLVSILHALVIDPKYPDVYFAGIAPDQPTTSGLWLTTDAGARWQPVPAFRGHQVRAIAFFRGESRIMAAGTDTGVFKTVDGGVHWARVSPDDNHELQPVVSVTFDPKDSHILYAGTPHLPWKTADGGITWTSIPNGMSDDSDIFSILVDRNRPQRIFAAACSGIYRSVTGGSSWTKLPGAKETSSRTYTIVQDPQYENALFAGTTHGMIRSRDGGATWEKIASYATRAITFDMQRLGRIFIATDEAGILQSDDNGRSWRPVNQGFCNRRLSSMAGGDHGGSLYVSTVYDAVDGGLFRLVRGAEEWTRVPTFPRVFAGRLFAATPSGSRTKLYATTGNSLVLSRDEGKTSASLNPPVAARSLTDMLVIPGTSDRIVAAATSSLFFSRDPSHAWRKLQFPGAAGIRSLVALDSPWVAALTRSGVFLSSDGETWKACAVLQGSGEIYGLAALPGQRLVAATSSGLWVSTNLCSSWRPLGGPLEGNTIQAIARHPVRTNELFAARYGLIFATRDAGRTWTRISPEDWPISSVKQLLVMPGAPDRLFVLTQYQGVFLLPLDTISEDLNTAW